MEYIFNNSGKKTIIRNYERDYIGLFFITILNYASAIFPGKETIFNILMVLIVLGLFLKSFVFEKIKVEHLIILFAASCFCLITKSPSRISLFVFSYMFFIFEKVDIKRCVKILFYTNLLCLAGILLAYFFGFNKEYDTTIYRPFLNATLYRYSLGFVHPNQFMIKLFYLFSLSIFYYDNKKIIFIWLPIFTLFYFLTFSRTVIYIYLLICFLYVIKKFFYKRKEYVYSFSKILKYGFFIMLLFSMIISFLFYGTKLDSLLSGRLIINVNMLNKGLSLFGNAALENAIIDNTYVQMIVTKGIAFVIIYSYIYSKNLNFKRMNINDAILLVGMLGYGFMEVCFLKYEFMILLALISAVNKKDSFNLRVKINKESV